MLHRANGRLLYSQKKIERVALKGLMLEIAGHPPKEIVT